MCVLFAATYPERARALVLYGTYAKRCDPDARLSLGADLGRAQRRSPRELEEAWGEDVDLSTMCARTPTPDDGRRGSSGAGARRRARRGARDLILMNSKADVRDVLPTVQCPTLVAPPHRRPRRPRRGGALPRRAHSAARASSSSRATTTSRSSTPDQILDEVEEFLTGVRPTPASDRVLATILFTDLVGSTERATSSATRPGRRCSREHHARACGASSRASGARRSTPPATASSPSSTARRARSAAGSRSARRSARSGSTSARASTPARSSGRPARSRADRRARRARVMALAASRRRARELDDARPRRRLGPRRSRTAASTR